MRENSTKSKLSRGETVFGCQVQLFRSAEIPRLFAAAGFDYMFIDAEHSGFDLETLQDMIAASVQSGITPIVRVGELGYSLMARVLDVRAQGIILPRVEEPRLLQEAISWIRFPPVGKRGYGIMAPMLDYAPRNFKDVIEHLNTNTLVVAQLETRAAIENCDELLSVPGLDVALLGPADLSISLGIPGQFDHPVFEEFVTRLIERCVAHQIIPGIQSRTIDLAMRWVERGMRFAGVGSEHGLLFEKAKETVSRMRGVGQASTKPAR